ncbi:unnamed protein product [Lepeophtheirus salmonis]|uniref:(salmon louse) hypothetical protein n=1 Tax=Lepeophtheirus salmonis TaxID=72036 RepID=A0A7R8HAK4_LEPSM|nr:unnamed protein product [Lepeophtheirus salmonis]CAF2972236.1 unnamed protein product [Lepeophtheirus salmonis]
MLTCLAFVPPRFVEQYFEHLLIYNDYPEESLPVLNYLKDNWIGRPTASITRQPPRFSHALYDPAKEDAILNKEQGKNESLIEQNVAGGEIPTRKKKYKYTNLRIHGIVNDFNNLDNILDF